MAKSNETSAPRPDAAKNAECSCGDHENGHKEQPGGKEQSKASDTEHTAHTSHTQSGSGCCGGGKANK
jgi:hypothetical protein